MKKYLSIAAAVMAVACTAVNLDETGAPDSSGPKFTASFEDNGTRVYVDGDLQTKWTADDRISIFTTTYNDQYRFDGKTGDDNGTFSKVVNSFNTGNDVPTNYAVYPYSSGTSITTLGTISLNLPATQSYAKNSYGLGASTMVAATQNSSSYSLSFKSLCGFLVVKLYGTGTVRTITLTGNNGEKIAGAATVSPVYGEAPSVSMSDSGTETITLDCGDGVELGTTAETATSFWFAIPPTTFSKGFTLTVTNTEGWSITKSTSSSRTVSRNVKQGMAALEAVFDTKAEFVYFEDANFKAYCVENFDTNNDGEISTAEAEVVTEISCSNKSITSLKGVEKFTALTQLRCYSNQLTTLDVSKNTELTYLDCNYNQLTTLDVSKSTGLICLYCYSNQLTTLDVSKNTELTQLWCDDNQLTTLDVSNNTELTELRCYSNQLATLDVSNNTELTKLVCRSNQLTSLDVSKNTELIDLWCYSNQLTSLDVSKNTKLTRLYCYSNQLATLDVSNNTELTELRCYSNQLTTLDVSNNTELTRLHCNNNPHLTEIWLKQGQTIGDFVYDTSVATLKYKGEYESVDLGLSVKWATFNVGAEAPWEYGTYFAWGDVTGQTWNGSSWSGGGFNNSPACELDDNNNLKPEYDAAHVNWGGTWRMPTKAEQQELMDNCTSTWTSNYNGTGVHGRIFTSNRTGYTDKSIFLPAAGYGDNGGLRAATSNGDYWSSTLCSSDFAWYIWFYSDIVDKFNLYRHLGMSVRPVTE